jgi:hypothetical protein
MTPRMRTMKKGWRQSIQNLARLNLSNGEAKHVDRSRRRRMSRKMEQHVEIFPF